MPTHSEQIDFLKNLKNKDTARFDEEFKRIKQELFNKYCFKKGYKDECDPVCVDAFTDKCKYLHEMRKLWEELDYPTE